MLPDHVDAHSEGYSEMKLEEVINQVPAGSSRGLALIREASLTCLRGLVTPKHARVPKLLSHAPHQSTIMRACTTLLSTKGRHRHLP